MTLDEWFAKYFASEYLNVQDKEAWTAQAKAELQQVSVAPAQPAPPAQAAV